MSEELSREQEAAIEDATKTWIDCALGGDTSLAPAEDLARMFEWLYKEVLGEPVPTAGLQIVVCDGPESAAAKAGELCGSAVAASSAFGLGPAVGWVARCNVFRSPAFSGVLPDDSEEAKRLDRVTEILRAGVWDTYCLDEAVIVIRRPTRATFDENERLHSVGDAPAVEWSDGTRLFASHDVTVPNVLWLNPETATLQQWQQANTEVIRVVAERIGWARYLTLRNAKLRDTWVDPDTGLQYELYDGGQFGLLRKQSPILKDDTQPWYCEPVPSACKTAAGARRWQIPGPDGRILSPEDAERRSQFRYAREA